MINLPTEFTTRMKDLLGDEYDAFLASYSQPNIKAFRVNTAKISLENFEKINNIPSEKIPFAETGYYFNYEHIGNHPFHHAGMIYVQEPAAMSPAECLNINPEWKILDMCAAPGGKSTQLKNKLGENGVLVSNEIIPSRCRILTGNIERLGLLNTVTTCMDSKKIAHNFPKTFNMIMVDAPCSGEGMFRKEPKAVEEWSLQNVKTCAIRQTEILENASLALADGGYIVYSTCTFSLEENEMVVDNFLKNHPEFQIMPVTERVQKCTADAIDFEGCETENINFARRFYPHISKGEGQFMAILHNTNPISQTVNITYEKSAKIDDSVTKFLDDTLVSYKKENVLNYNGNFVYFTPDFKVEEKIAFSCGVTIGEKRKSYIQPHHQFFMGLGKHFKRKIELAPESVELQKYLHGEEFETECENGWAVVTVCGCAVGGVKVVSNKAKNHYPKGLRTKY